MRMRKQTFIKLSSADSTTETLIYSLLGLSTENLTDYQLNYYWEQFEEMFTVIHDDGRKVTVYGRW